MATRAYRTRPRGGRLHRRVARWARTSQPGRRAAGGRGSRADRATRLALLARHRPRSCTPRYLGADLAPADRRAHRLVTVVGPSTIGQPAHHASAAPPSGSPPAPATALAAAPDPATRQDRGPGTPRSREVMATIRWWSRPRLHSAPALRSALTCSVVPLQHRAVRTDITGTLAAVAPHQYRDARHIVSLIGSPSHRQLCALPFASGIPSCSAALLPARLRLCS